ncbi:hypothetical protein ACQJBY_050896 [Aegilops geniculata]
MIPGDVPQEQTSGNSSNWQLLLDSYLSVPIWCCVKIQAGCKVLVLGSGLHCQHPTSGAPDHRRQKRRRAIHSIVLSPCSYLRTLSTSCINVHVLHFPRQVEAAPSTFTPLSSFASRIRHPHVGSVGADGITMTHANVLIV